MGLLECASGASVQRGYDYYNEKKVKNITETASGVFTADVIGTANGLMLLRSMLRIRENQRVTVLTPTASALSASIWWQLILPHIPKRQLDFTKSI